jgi:hypothetical protein
MESANKFRDIIWKLSRMSPLVWAFILLSVAFVFVKIDGSLMKKFAILPTVVAFFLFYQAIFRGKMY